MSDHITIIKLKKDVANTIDFEKTHTLDLHLKYKGEFAAFNGRLDSIDKRLSNIINTGKKLTRSRFPVIVTKWKNDIDKTIEFIDSTKDDEVIILSI